MTAQDFLVEIGTEELPPKALRRLRDSFTQSVTAALQDAQLRFAADRVQAFATPRRLAIFIPQLLQRQPDIHVEKLGPALAAAFDKEGKPTKAAQGFARGHGVSVEQLAQVDSDKGQRLCFRATQPGQEATSLLPDIIESALAQLPIPKRMRWGASKVEFVRPVHWIIMLYGNTVVDCEVLGIKADRLTRGHRFHCHNTLSIEQPDQYESTLAEQGDVVADFDKRRGLISEAVKRVAEEQGGRAVIGEELLDEVTALVEKPVPLAGRFEERFLDVPAEALISSMSEHQKYFHVVDGNNKLMPLFITVANIHSTDPAQVIDGNERVIRPRLADAAFFFETDKKTPLAERRDRLKSIVFQQKLGSLFDKSQRVAELAQVIADKIGADSTVARRAAELAKADLVSDMVLEFDKMQGIAGYYYALHDGEADDVAIAIKEQYLQVRRR